MDTLNGKTKSKRSLYLGISIALALAAVAIIDPSGVIGIACLGLAAMILLVSMILR